MIIIWGFETAEPHNVAGDRRKKEGGDHSLSYGPARSGRRTATECSWGV